MANYQMSEKDKDALRTERLYILQNVIPSIDLLGYLSSTKTLTEDMVEEIEAEKIKKSQVGKLLDILPRRGPDAFKNFIFALMQSEQKHVARSLDAAYANEWEENRRLPPYRSSPSKPPPSRQISGKRSIPVTPLPSSGQFCPVDSESPFMVLDIMPVDTDDPYMLKLINDTKNVYKMTTKPRGRALIINNSYFINSAPREGAAIDSQNLCVFLEKLDFQTVLYDNISAQEIITVLEEESQQDHWNSDCFLLFILSHGSKGFVYGIDGKKVSIERDVVTPFDGNRCAALINKPKMFFIQACQGAAVTEGIAALEPSDCQVDASPIPENMNIEEAFSDLRIQDTDETFPHISRAHEKSDIVLAYSTVPGYRAWRRTDLGSWFVRAVVEIFSKESHQEDLLSLLVKVRQHVAENQTNHEDHSFIQLTRTDETTKKKIYLFPGYYYTNRGDSV